MPKREIDQTKLGKTTRRGLTFGEILNVLWNLGTQTNWIILKLSGWGHRKPAKFEFNLELE